MAGKDDEYDYLFKGIYAVVVSTKAFISHNVYFDHCAIRCNVN